MLFAIYQTKLLIKRITDKIICADEKFILYKNVRKCVIIVYILVSRIITISVNILQRTRIFLRWNVRELFKK